MFDQKLNEALTDNRLLTPLEKACWTTLEGNTILPKRSYFYDPTNYMYYWPTEYIQVPIEHLDRVFPNDEWIIDASASMILGISQSGVIGQNTVLDKDNIKQYVSDDIAFRILENFETEIAFSDLVFPIAIDDRLETWEKVHKIFCHPVIGNPKNSKNISTTYIRKKIEIINQTKLPLQIVVPAFPFKDQNPFRTNAEPDHIDLGEIALLIRMHALALSLYQVYPFGVEWIIVSDGVIYSEIFDIDQVDAFRYQSHLRSFRNRLNLQKTIHIVDLYTLTSKIQGFSVVQTKIRERLFELFTTGKNNAFVDKVNILARGMRWNLNTRKYQNNYSNDEIWGAIHQYSAKSNHEKTLYDLMKHEGERAAIEYLAVNLSLKWLDVIYRFYPFALRATVHPKKDQIALPHRGNLFPWNGVATLPQSQPDMNLVETEEFYKVIQKGPVDEFVLFGSNAPFYYNRDFE